MGNIIKELLIISFLIITIDVVVLSSLSKLWKDTIEKVQKKTFIPKIHYAIASYILIVLGQYYFVFRHIKHANWVNDSLLNGFLFGFVLYGVFDFTNLAIFTDYPLFTATVDMMWGGILMAITSLISYYILEVVKI